MLYVTNYSLQGQLNKTLSFFILLFIELFSPFPVVIGKINQIEYVIYLGTCFLYSDFEKLIGKFIELYWTLKLLSVAFT